MLHIIIISSSYLPCSNKPLAFPFFVSFNKLFRAAALAELQDHVSAISYGARLEFPSFENVGSSNSVLIRIHSSLTKFVQRDLDIYNIKVNKILRNDDFCRYCCIFHELGQNRDVWLRMK